MAAEFNQKNFDEEILKSDLALVDFWCSWCLPSQSEKTILDGVAEEFKGEIKVAMVNLDRNPVLREKFQVKGVPTFIFFKKGKEAKRAVGAKSKEQLITLIKECQF